MKGLAIRVNKAEVYAEGRVISSIGKGIALFVGIEKDDTSQDLEGLAQKVTDLRIFEDDCGKMNYSLRDKNYSILCISNFTLCANTDKGRRPSFEKALPKKGADKIFDDFITLLKARNIDVQTGIFGAKMKIDLELDGPVNIVLETRDSEL